MFVSGNKTLLAKQTRLIGQKTPPNGNAVKLNLHTNPQKMQLLKTVTRTRDNRMRDFARELSYKFKMTERVHVLIARHASSVVFFLTRGNSV